MNSSVFPYNAEREYDIYSTVHSSALTKEHPALKLPWKSTEHYFFMVIVRLSDIRWRFWTYMLHKYSMHFMSIIIGLHYILEAECISVVAPWF